MSQLTNTKTPNPNNPSALKPRYEIRRLEPEHAVWVAAIAAHSNCFHSPVWTCLYPENLSGRMHTLFGSLDYLCLHQINSGMSFGVFDTEYQYKTEEAKKVGGKLYWDPKEPSIEKEQGSKAEGERLLAQMDFPLVSIALSYDAFNHVDMDKLGPLIACLPHYALLFEILNAQDSRDPASYEPTGPGQVIFRNATSTRHDYEGEGIMGALARFLMREAAQKGYRGIQIESLADAVEHVWGTAEEPFQGEVITGFECATWKNEKGELGFPGSKQRITRCYVDLQPKF